MVRQTWSKSLTGLAEMRGRKRKRDFTKASRTFGGRFNVFASTVPHRNKGLRSYKLPISLQRSVNSLQPKEKWTADRVLLRECNDAWLIMMSNSK